MMFRLAKISLANRALIALITVFAAVFGVITMGSLKQELIPSIEFPQVAVLSSKPGASAEVMDKQVSGPLQQALNGVEGVQSSSATSREGVSTISLQFAYGTNLDRARSQVDRAISNAKRVMPSDVDPQSFSGSLSDIPVVYLAVSSDKTLSELKTDLDRLSVPELLKLPGVRGVEVTGAAGQHISIVPDPKTLSARGLSSAAISKALDNNGGLIPAGTLEDNGKDLSLQIGSPVDSLDAVKALPLAGANQPTTIGQVASVSIKDDESTSITRTNGVQTLALSITKKPEADTVSVSHQISDLLPKLSQDLGNNAKLTTVFDQAPYIEKSIKDLTVEGLLGLGFAVIVILVFLLSVRSTLVTAISIPLSLLITFIGLNATQYSLNILTLGALTIAIGRVVDDSIVVIENIKRHLSYGEEKQKAILTAIREVAGAITASTLTTVAVFLPIAFVGDIAGELFRPFALTVTIALIASLAVSLTIVPVLAYWFLKGDKVHAHSSQTQLEAAHEKERKSWLARAYVPVLHGTQRHPVITLVAAVVILVATFAMTPLLPTNLLGDSGQNSLSIRQSFPAGTPLEQANKDAAKVEEKLKSIDGLHDVQVVIGNASSGFAAMQSSGSSDANFTVVTDEKKDQAALQDQVRSSLESLNDVGTITVGAQQGGFGGSNTVDVTIAAPDTATLTTATDQMMEAFKDLPGSTSITNNLAATVPLVQVKVDRAKVTALGLDERQVGALVAAATNPTVPQSVRIGTTDFPVQVGEGKKFTSIEQLRGLPLAAAQATPAAPGSPSTPAAPGSPSTPGNPGPDTTPGAPESPNPAPAPATPSAPLTLGQIATVQEVSAPSSLTSSNGQRTAKISITPDGSNLGALTQEVTSKLEGIELPSSATATLGGASTQQADSFRQLGLALLAAVAIVYVIMVATFKSLIQPLILLVSVPFAATGAIGLLLITRVPLGLPSLIGMLMLVGIVVTNAIVLIDLINQYRRGTEGEPAMNVAEAIEHGARRRLRPILMTAAATIFALVPMAMGVTGGGGFISQPLAIVVIGGLISSTLLTLVLVPVLYRLVEGSRERRQQRREAAHEAEVHAEANAEAGSGA